MDAARLSPPRRLTVPIDNRWGAGDLSVLDFGDPKRPVDLVFCHANGFNAQAYRSILAPLASSLRILAPDLRGHGATTLPLPAKRKGWQDHRDDLVALLDSIDGPPVVLAGHSMGATSALLATAERPEKVSQVVAFDPVIWKRWAVAALKLPLIDRLPGHIPLVKGALRRRARFDSREQALAAYRNRGAFRGWSDVMVVDYLGSGLKAEGDGFVLTCPPTWEASNYAAQGHDPWKAMRDAGRPVRILKAENGSTCAVEPSPRGLPLVTVETVAEGTHFFPMLRPDIARDALFDAAV
ncbi:alpha/beta hydrolase [Brevundimonas sp. NIBR11]|uniref:alpha/beta fold hydrolase n=1 Tax=Brevundimonas sp. NIBR11 TaxID=3015999 RepID=UPI0022F02B33|nr:alpha/beta hydrolase [Brevundimonas sp. NIBR11]WGM32871.1 Haloalkane dehalogenase [Brevundimonas sp. NIBR11]